MTPEQKRELLHQFAGQAMQAMIAGRLALGVGTDTVALVAASFELADAMVAEAERRAQR